MNDMYISINTSNWRSSNSVMSVDNAEKRKNISIAQSNLIGVKHTKHAQGLIKKYLKKLHI